MTIHHFELATDSKVYLVPLPHQVIFALPPVGDTDLTMRIFNSDGSEPEMCGNGIRCLARFVADIDNTTAGKYRIHTLAGDAWWGLCDLLVDCIPRFW